MKVELQLTDLGSAYIIQNLYPAYLHDLSQFQDFLPNQHGLFEDESIQFYSRETFLREWWQHPGRLFPLLICVDNRPAGFALIASLPFVTTEADYVVQEFFLIHPYRNKGLGQVAAQQMFNQFAGTWKLSVLPRNRPARGFWCKLISSHTQGEFTEDREETPDGLMIVFRFRSR